MATDIYYTLLTAAQATIQGLGLTGLPSASPLPSAQVYLRKLNIDRDDVLPAVFVAPSEDAEQVIELSFEDPAGVGVDYSVGLVIVAADNQDLTGNLKTYLRWREQIRRAFQSATVGALESWPDGLYDASPRLWTPLDRERWHADNLACLGMTAVFSVSEQRTN